MLRGQGHIHYCHMPPISICSTLTTLEGYTVDHFDWLAPLYDRVIQAPGDDTLSSLLDLPIEGRLLDAGGGTGRIAERLQSQAEQIVIADGSLPMLSKAMEKGCCDVVGSNTERLPFGDGAFQRVIVVDAYHHLADQRASLDEFWRVLAPGGLLVIEEPDIDRFVVKLVALVEKLTFFRSHFVRAENIADGLRPHGADLDIHRVGHNAWVVAKKT
jgi:demethylmenaquinone methyltransferase/2-methoxy-6-polyprenyl-1,4-benzoquinol methylase